MNQTPWGPLAFCLVLSLAFVDGCNWPWVQARTEAEHAKEVDALFARWEKAGSPGVAVAVVKKGEAIYKKGFGRATLEHDIPITSSTVFNIASVSKQFTAMAIALLVDRGEIVLDDDIRTYIPEVPDFGKTITIRHLVHHTSGIRDWLGTLAIAGWRVDDAISVDQILRMVWKQKDLNFEPGAQHLYSNTGYDLLAEIVERVTGQSFRAWTAAHMFKPLGMTHTHFHDDHRMVVKNRAQSYRRKGTNYQRVRNWVPSPGSSSLFTTLDDLVKWAANFERPIVGGSGVHEMMHQRGVLNNGEQIRYAFGQSIGDYKGLKIVAHSGSSAGFRTRLLRFPDHSLAIILLSNVANFQTTEKSNQVADIYLADHFDVIDTEPEETERTEVKVDPARLNDYVGTFKLGKGWYVTITNEDGKLMTQATRETKFEMTAVSETKFWVGAYAAHIVFERNETGAADRFAYRGMTAPRVAVVQADSLNLAEYEGTYESEELETRYSVRPQKGRLIMRHQRHGDIPLIPSVADTFAGGVWFIDEVVFTRDAAGCITGFLASKGRSHNARFLRRAQGAGSKAECSARETTTR